jgi:hypothetical protein
MASCVLLLWQLLQENPYLVGRPVGIIPHDLPMNTSWFPSAGATHGLGNVDCNGLAEEFKGRLQQKVEPAEVKALMAVLIGRRCR